jgi:hypothetical protein
VRSLGGLGWCWGGSIIRIKARAQKLLEPTQEQAEVVAGSVTLR